MCLPLNNQGQCKTALQGPGENILDTCRETNPAHPWPFSHSGCPEEPGEQQDTALLKHRVIPPYKRLVRWRDSPEKHITAMYAAGRINVLFIWAIKFFSKEHVLSNSAAILPGHSSDSTAKGLCTTCPRGLHGFYSTVQRTGLKKTRKVPEMGVWATSPFNTTAFLQSGIWKVWNCQCCNTSVSLENYNLKLEPATQLKRIFSL